MPDAQYSGRADHFDIVGWRWIAEWNCAVRFRFCADRAARRRGSHLGEKVPANLVPADPHRVDRFQPRRDLAGNSGVGRRFNPVSDPHGGF